MAPRREILAHCVSKQQIPMTSVNTRFAVWRCEIKLRDRFELSIDTAKSGRRNSTVGVGNPPAAGLEFVVAEDPAILRPIEQASHRRAARQFSCPTYLFGMENHQ